MGSHNSTLDKTPTGCSHSPMTPFESATAQHRGPLGAPEDTSLPLFVYGMLQPGEIAWPRVRAYVSEVIPADGVRAAWLHSRALIFSRPQSGEGGLRIHSEPRSIESTSIVRGQRAIPVDP